MDTTNIGSKLVKLRGNRTQEQVANAVGISVSALSMYECGERIPRDGEHLIRAGGSGSCKPLKV